MRKLTAILTIVLAGCGGADDSDNVGGNPDGGGEELDTTPPTIVSISPENGAVGVRADTAVVIEFSEPMDQLSVQNTLDTSDLAGVQFSWSDGGKIITITPDEPLAYAEGTDPAEVDALVYVVTLGSAAADEAGNTVDSGIQTIFSTMREISVTVGIDDAMTASLTPGEVYQIGDNDIYAGDDGEGALAKGIRGAITMDISVVHQDAEEIVSASLLAFQSGFNGNVWVELGAMLIDHASFDVASDDWATATDLECNAAFNNGALASAGTLMADEEDINVELDVTAFVQDDLDNRADRADRSQYIVRMFDDLNLDENLDGVSILRESLEMDIVYLVP